jgi:hypothetical protein
LVAGRLQHPGSLIQPIGRDEDAVAAETARYLEIPLGLVQAAISYYGAYRDEIDQWIDANEQQAAEAHAAWTAGQDAVRP